MFTSGISFEPLNAPENTQVVGVGHPFTDEETEVQRKEIACLGSQTKLPSMGTRVRSKFRGIFLLHSLDSWTGTVYFLFI